MSMLKRLLENKNNPKVLKSIIKGIEEETEYNNNVEKAMIEESKSLKKKPSEYKESNIMKARSDIKKKGDKYIVETDMNIKKDLLPKAKRALKKSVETELKKELGSISGKGGGASKEAMKEIMESKGRRSIPETRVQKLFREDEAGNKHTEEWNEEYFKFTPEEKKEFRRLKDSKGRGIRKIDLDMSSDEEEKPKKRRGRPPKKGKGYESDSSSDSSSDEDDIKEYGKILEHLLKHIKDPKEKIDKDDYKQAIELIKKIKSKKA